jgi:hypothetical protein
MDAENIEALLDPSLYIGRSAEQTEEFIVEYIEPIINDADDMDEVELKV